MSEVNSELLENYIDAQKQIDELEGKNEQFEMIKDGVASFELDKESEEDITKIKGVALQEGTWNGYFYPEGELKKSAGDLAGNPLVVDHGKGVKDIVGEVTDSSWDSKKEVLRFEGEIVNDEVAELVKRHLVDGVSIGANFDPVKTDKGKTVTNLDFYELALTTEPAAPDGIKEVLHRKDVDYGGDNLMTEEEEGKEAEIKEAIKELNDTLGTEKTGIFVGAKGENDYPSYYGYYPGYYPSYYPSYYPEYYPKKEGNYPAPKLTDIVKKLVKVVEGEFDKDLEEVELEEAGNDYPEAYGGYPAPKLTEIVQKLVKVIEDELDIDLEEVELSGELSEEEESESEEEEKSKSEEESEGTEESGEESEDTPENYGEIERKVESLDEKIDALTDSIEEITKESNESDSNKEEPEKESKEESGTKEETKEEKSEETSEETEESEDTKESEGKAKESKEAESEETESEEGGTNEVNEEDLEDLTASDLIFKRHEKRHGS